ncbi:hypothetical protein T440DRAFT_550976 [Plenodomus tracheiphilus IPT5]|uniref:Pre-mRNA polyadenylation factor Fip1 domain-containing protein n=1 Tax=Plenodomus tracheiphilus IPT5 TaxID=1408161 RepID=A0A6A7BJD1_9PLEO|nr:hypothetical protein T440DRAFT_550976 [Plenodomus tracheiphilus IPT5]
MADEDNSDDDLYGTEESSEQKKNLTKEDGASSGDEPMDEAESGDEEDEDSESDLEIIIDKPPTAHKPSAQPPSQESKAIKIEAPPLSTTTPSQPPRPSSTAPQQHPPGSIVPQLALTPGTSYPAIRSSTLDINANPTYPPAGKPVLSMDMDADLADEQKIWRLPGTDQSDFFNYGFDEFTWELYRQRQISMANALQLEETTMQAMKTNMQMMGAGPGPGNGGPMPGMPSGMGGMPGGGGGGPPMGPGGGMPNVSPEEMVNMLQAQGMNPAQMSMEDFGQMMQSMGGGMGGFPGMGGQQQGGGGGYQQQQGNHGGGGGRGRGRGRGGW